ncbi:hypothetical protein [Streptomyces sp. NPDC056669]|uniref:hypothetical protein n=1 Tax=unclassified Streptomyces TaxID=2593676 RepID=UPI0036C42427
MGDDGRPPQAHGDLVRGTGGRDQQGDEHDGAGDGENGEPAPPQQQIADAEQGGVAEGDGRRVMRPGRGRLMGRGTPTFMGRKQEVRSGVFYRK